MALKRPRREGPDAEFPVAPVSTTTGVQTVPTSMSGSAPASGRGGVEGPRHRGVRIGDLLVSRGLVSQAQLDEALTKQRELGVRLGRALVQLGFIHERDLAIALADQMGLEVVDLRHAKLDPEVVALLPEQLARDLSAIPVRREGTRVEIAVSDPLSPDLQTRLIQAVEAPVRIIVAGVEDIELAIGRSYKSTAKVDDAIRVFEARNEARKATSEAPAESGISVDESAPIVKVVNLILEQAVRDRASDVHIEPQEDQVRVRVRTDGALHEVLTLPANMGQSLASRIKVMADLNIVEKRRPQDGQFHTVVHGNELDVRVSTTSTVFGEKVVLRLLDKTKAFLTVSDLGMSADATERYLDLVRSPYGMVICAGPTGSGKTTTLYATLAEIAREDINVTTIEDPVEYIFPSITQIQINDAAGVTFAAGLRSILRQDPDAILVGEIRDIETARIAIQAALTGHFVMSSLHATDSIAALYRFMDMGIEPFLISSALLGVVAQRLVRKSCPHCLEEYTPTDEEVSFYRRGGGDELKARWMRGVGCNFCTGTGYLGRIGIYEVLQIDDELRRAIVQGVPQEQIRDHALENGMRTLRDQALRLVTDDSTTLAEVLRTVYVL